MDANEPEALYRYKYRSIDEGNLKIITEGSLKFSSPLEFNDPFDSTPAYSEESILEFQRRRPDIMRQAGKAMNMSPAERIKNRKKFEKNIQRTVDSGEWARAVMGGLGIFCVSRTACNPLMWAHYAHEHKGFVVEFRIGMDAPHSLLSTMIPFPVDYSKTRPILDWGARDCQIKEYFLTKSDDWAYEQEERVMVTAGPGLYPYCRKTFLSSVIAGCRTSEKAMKKLQAAVLVAEQQTGKKIPLYRAELSSKAYKVYVPGHPDPAISSPD